jgi:hypothetical protein
VTDYQAQCLSFAYGNLACTTNHKPTRSAFRKVALDLGVTEEEFEVWAREREWWERKGESL